MKTLRPLGYRLALLLCTLNLGGCTALQYTSGAVTGYCGLPDAARTATREAVALAVAPNRITIQCARDE